MNPVSTSAQAEQNPLCRGGLPERIGAIKEFELLLSGSARDPSRVGQQALTLLVAIEHEGNENLLNKLGLLFRRLHENNPEIFVPRDEVGRLLVSKTLDVLDQKSSSTVVPIYLLDVTAGIGRDAQSASDSAAHSAWTRDYKGRYQELASKLISEQLLVIRRMGGNGEPRDLALQADFDRRYQIARIGLRGLTVIGTEDGGLCDALDNVLKHDFRKARALENLQLSDSKPKDALLQSIDTLHRLIAKGIDPENLAKFKELLSGEKEVLAASREKNPWQISQPGFEFVHQRWIEHTTVLLGLIDDALAEIKFCESGARWFAA